MNIFEIRDGDKVVLELCTFDHGTFSEFAIKRKNGTCQMISREKFFDILSKAKERGYSVFDYMKF